MSIDKYRENGSTKKNLIHQNNQISFEDGGDIASSARSFFVVSFIHEICIESHNNGPKRIAQTATTTNFNESN